MGGSWTPTLDSMLASCLRSDNDKLRKLGKTVRCELFGSRSAMEKRVADLEAENELLRFKLGKVRDIIEQGD